MFKLDSRLENDCFFVADLEVSRLLLMNDQNYPWLILVPRIENLTELTDLDFATQTKVLQEINDCTKMLQQNFEVDKLNIGALGNVVLQLHIHIIGRKKNDITFPKPVWGNAQANPYAESEAKELIEKIKSILK